MTTSPAPWQPEPGGYPPGYGPAAGQGTSRRSRRTALLISGAVVLVLLAAGVAGERIHQAQLLPPGGPALVVPAPATAGPLTRDYAAEAGADRAVIQKARTAIGKGSALLSNAEFAVYRQPGHHMDPVSHAATVIFYIGMQFKPDTTGSLSDFMRGFANSLGSAGHLSPVSPGRVGGLAECTGTAVETICVWDAGHSAGMLVAPAGDITPAQLAVLMRAARPAFETTRAVRS